ncbi:hypothetical protein [Novosphingobium terrae]|uniref:hypothetical protein n=1 Tax=Novosphingobium terrae TaxID=2726189 RepID=UPI0019826296|nr:hypothetical protein [Novosphingobium terrae]
MNMKELTALNTSRRNFMAGVGAIAASQGIPSAQAASPIIDQSRFASQERLWSDVKTMVSYGLRYPGTANHLRYCAFINQRLRDAGLIVEQLERHSLDVWEPRKWSIVSASGKAIRVAATNRESSSTGPDGVTAPLKYCGTAKGTVFGAALDPSSFPHIDIPADVKGKIALIEVEIEPLPFGRMFEGQVAAVVDRSHAGGMPAVQPMATAWNNTESRLPATLEEDLRKAGAEGVIYAWANIVDDDGQGQIRRNGTAALPSLWVAMSGARALRALEASGEPVTLTIEAHVTPAVHTATTVATLPGMSDETILVWTHTDGMNAIQENGSIAVVNLMKYFAGIPKEQRKRTITCVLSEGHLALNHTPDIWWATQRPDIMAKAVASISMEHMGCREWLGHPEANTFTPTDKPDVSWAFTFAPEDKPNYLAKIMEQALGESTLARTVVTSNSPFSFCPGLHPWTLAKVPSIGYISTPSYFLAEAPDGHISKLCPALYHEQVLTMARAIRLLDAAPRAMLREA